MATTASAVYNHYLGRSRDGLLAAREVALEKARGARIGAPATGAATAPDLREAEEELRRVEEEIAEADLDEASGEGGDARSRFAWVPWRRVALASAGLFGIVMAAILVFELVVDRPVASFTGGIDSTARGTTLGSSRSGDTADGTEQDDAGGSDSTETSTPTPDATSTDTGGDDGDAETSGATSDPTDLPTTTAPDEGSSQTTSAPTTTSAPSTTQAAAGAGALGTGAGDSGTDGSALT